MGIKTVPQTPYSPDIAHCDFRLFPKLRGCRYETIEEMKEAVTKVIDTLRQEAFQKLLERYTKCIAAGGDYLEWDKSFMCVLSIKVPIRKKSGNLFDDPPISMYIHQTRLGCDRSQSFVSPKLFANPKLKKFRLSCFLLVAGEKIVGFIAFPMGISAGFCHTAYQSYECATRLFLGGLVVGP